MQLFGWDLKFLWQTVNQQRCHALVGAGDVGSALEACLYMMDMSDEPTKASFRAWIPGESSLMPPSFDAHLHVTQLSMKNEAHFIIPIKILLY